MKRAILTLCVVALGFAMLSELQQRRKEAEAEIKAYLGSRDRYVDMGVVLKVVVADPNGTELVPGKPPLRVIAEHRRGGIVDTRALRPYFRGPSRKPVVWNCSEDQARILLHDDPKQLGILVYGSEGAGKTRTLAMWHGLRVLEHIGESREGGQTAPTDQRLEFIRIEFAALFPKTWVHHFKAADLYVFCDGTRIQLVSTYRQSAAQGSPIQGFNWSWCGRDEGQDQVEVHADIQQRGRAARGGGKFYKQLITATAKDDPNWRTLRDVILTSGTWIKHTLSIFRSPFIDRGYIEMNRGLMSEREFKRRYGSESGEIFDLPPELAVYPEWSRDTNLIQIPEDWAMRGWVDVTASELARWGGAAMLGGHDPGSLFDVSEFLQAFRLPPRDAARICGVKFHEPPRMDWMSRPAWFVRDEVTTEQTTTEQHVDVVNDRIRGKWKLNLKSPATGKVEGGSLFVRADPYGNNDSKPDRACYTVFRNAGIKIEPAAYNEEGTGPGRVPKDAGIEVVKTLLCSARGERYLFVERLPDGKPAAPKLVEAFEGSEKDHRGKAETQRKNIKDLSHWPAAIRYALWVIERPRLHVVRA